MNFVEFSDRSAASIDAAFFVAGALGKRLASASKATLIVSGGNTPIECLKHLSLSPVESLDWNRVSVMPTDERCVAADHEASNEGMIRRCLLQRWAKSATFVSLLQGGREPINQQSVIEQSKQLACALVGLGEDGHFASIFPDNEDLPALLATDAEPQLASVTTSASEYNRVTANLSLLLSGDSVLLLAFGEKKKEVLLNPDGLPVASLLQQDKTPVRVVWAP
ncbi:MAG: 6-phosphogluconolactonase [Pseudohongiellaceae bacterium]